MRRRSIESLTLAARTPDHGKLFPWRFLTVTDRPAFAALLERAFVAANPGARPMQIEAATAIANMAPMLVHPAARAAAKRKDTGMGAGIIDRRSSDELAPCRPCPQIRRQLDYGMGDIRRQPSAQNYAKAKSVLRASSSSERQPALSKSARAPIWPRITRRWPAG